MIDREFLVIDIETTSTDVNIAEVRVFGAYDPYEDKYFIYKWNDTNMAKVVELLATYKLIITFNGKKYDIPILKKYGIPIDFKHVDIYEIFKYKRTQLIRPQGFDSYSLKALILQLGLDPVGKGDIDYKIFCKPVWTVQEQRQIILYLKQDLLLTWKLWDYLLTRFRIFESFISEKDRSLYKHITTPLYLLAYKIICNGAQVQELYDEKPKPQTFPKPIISTPRRHTSDNAVLFKFTYLYAHIIMQFNLASVECDCCNPNSGEGKFHGKNFYTVKGYYCQKNLGRIEKFLKQLYKDSNNIPGYDIVADIVFRKVYEVFTNPLFYSVYDVDAAYDMYLLAKQQLKMMMRKFEDAGFLVLYIDMDQVFIHIPPGKTLGELLSAKDNIITYMKSKMPFPSETFDLLLCEELSYLTFFKKSGKDPFMRKGMYVYINKEGFVGAKGVDNDTVNKIVQEYGVV